MTSDKEQMVVKFGLLGDYEVGKSSFMRRYVDGNFHHSYTDYYDNAPGSVLFLEKQIEMADISLYLGLWCATTSTVYESALQLVCADANVLLFMFSLTNKSSLYAIKAWYESASQFNKNFIPILVGTKYDIIHESIKESNPLSHHYSDEYHRIIKLARNYAMKISAPLIFTSSKSDTNIKHVIKTAFSKVFNLHHKLKQHHWNTLVALREHNVHKVVRTWSDTRNVQHLIRGYLKKRELISGSHLYASEHILSVICKYCLYDLQPYAHKRARSALKQKPSLNRRTSRTLSYQDHGQPSKTSSQLTVRAKSDNTDSNSSCADGDSAKKKKKSKKKQNKKKKKHKKTAGSSDITASVQNNIRPNVVASRARSSTTSKVNAKASVAPSLFTIADLAIASSSSSASSS